MKELGTIFLPWHCRNIGTQVCGSQVCEHWMDTGKQLKAVVCNFIYTLNFTIHNLLQVIHARVQIHLAYASSSRQPFYGTWEASFAEYRG